MGALVRAASSSVAPGQAGGGAVTFDFYVDSVNGDDGNDGADLASAFETPSVGEAALGAGLLRLGLARNSEWSTPLIFSEDDTVVGVAGTGDIPSFDGAGPVAETWAQHDAGGLPSTWNIDVTHGWTVANGRMMIWEDGALLKRVASIALVNAEAGTYYSPGDNLWTGNVTYKVYVHATGSGDPNSNGKSYERTQIQKVVHGAYAGVTGVVVRDLIVGRQGDNDGAIVLGADSTLERVLAYDGHKHNALQESGLCKNSAFVNAQPESNYLHVFYTPTATGMEGAYEDCVFVGQTNGLRGTSGIYCHDNSGVGHDLLTVDGCLFQNMAAALSSSAVTLNVTGVYIENVNSAVTAVTGSVSELTHLLVNKQYLRNAFNAAGAHAVRQSAIYGQSNATIFQMTATNWGDVLLENCTIHMGDWDTTISSYERNIVSRTAGTGTFSAENCIFLMDATDTTVAPVVKLNTASIGTFNNNVYFYRGSQTKAALRWQVDGVNKTFAEWQALGHDLNSIVVDDETDTSFANFMNGHPSTGDFRLKSGLAITLPDLTPVSALGVQEHYNFATGAVVAGAPSQWPTMPETYAEGATYITDPEAWDFYP